MKIGTKTVAITAHFAEALPIKRLTDEVSRTKASMSAVPSRPDARNISAPSTATISPSLVPLK